MNDGTFWISIEDFTKYYEGFLFFINAFLKELAIVKSGRITFIILFSANLMRAILK